MRCHSFRNAMLLGVAVCVLAACNPVTPPDPPPPTAAEKALTDLGLRPLAMYTRTTVLRVPFETTAEATGWYVTPQTPVTHHELSTSVFRAGKSAHKAWVTGPNVGNTEPDGPNHRGYPTMQLYKRPRGCVTPCLVTLWVWADVALKPGEWSQVATLTPAATDSWLPAHLVNVGSEGWLHTMHVPTHGLSQWRYQRKDLMFPKRQWVKVDILIDYRNPYGAIAAFQNGTLISAARIDGSVGASGAGVLNQAHFGLYMPPTVASAVVYNDDLEISEVR